MAFFLFFDGLFAGHHNPVGIKHWLPRVHRSQDEDRREMKHAVVVYVIRWQDRSHVELSPRLYCGDKLFFLFFC